MDFGKMILSGLKSFAYALVGVAIAALAVAQAYQPADTLGIVLMKYLVAPAIAGVISMLKNYLQHKDD